MVRQASCDVSDRNDKGSPDTVWQILGSCRGSFSCSKTSAAQTQDPALASRKQTLQSEQGGLCQVPERCLLCLFARTHAPVRGPEGQQSIRAAGLDSHRHQWPPPSELAQSPPAEVSGSRGLATQQPRGLTFSICTPNQTKSSDLVPRMFMVIPPVLGSCRLPGGHLLRARKLLSGHSWQLLTLSLYSHSFRKLPRLKLKKK